MSVDLKEKPNQAPPATPANRNSPQRSDPNDHPDSKAKGDDGEDQPPKSAAEQAAGERTNKRKKLIVIVALVVAAVIAVIAGVLWWLHARHYENTDDAYIDARITHVAPRAAGEIRQIFVTDNQAVRPGQLLVQLDDSAAQAQLAEAEAMRAQALSQIGEARAQVRVASSQLDQARANTLGPTAQADKADRDFQRYAKVYAETPAAVAPQQLDQMRTTAINDRAQLVGAEKQVKTNRSQLASSRTQIVAGSTQLQTAEARIGQARLQIGYARVVALVDGRIANRTLAVGNYAQPGQEVMSIVPNQLWITANFKETQLATIRLGQRVEVKIDAYPDMAFTGRVDSIQRGAGQSFAVLPAQNATGNFVKVVQRVPVKIVLDPIDLNRFPLGPGMSATTAVRVN